MTTLKKCVVSIKFYNGDSDELDQDVVAVNATMQYAENRTLQLRELNIHIPQEAEEGDFLFDAMRSVDFESFVRSLSKTGRALNSAPGKETNTPSANDPKPTKDPAAFSASRRPYRRMPDAEEVKKVFLDTKSVGKLAQHYDVPRYTAQAWVDRLRRQGALKA